ncbi:hypothetical protein [Streptomyces geranii]|uniref:hypothetical protein n=1 Tax=Streptomyces geranii TaxID=2058923 RepID=UPI001E465295|nr:hypothetical protein [Streptomyces geranii]
MRELSRKAFPEPGVPTDDQPAAIKAARALALRRARQERASRTSGTVVAVPESAALRTTA